MTLERALSVAYAIDGFIYGCMYIPQIVALVRDKTGAASISLTAWVYWSLSGLLSVVYCGFVVKDALATAVFLVSTFFSTAVTITALIKKHPHRRTHHEPVASTTLG